MKQRNKCGICEGSDLVKVIDLGEMPLANSFLTKEELDEPEKTYPLRVGFCRSCTSVQLLDIIDPEFVFRDYAFLTSASKPAADHFIEMGRDLADRFIKDKKDVVIEIGGNDGVLCEAIKDRCWVLNYEPSKEAARLSRGRGVNTVRDFFNTTTAREILSVFGKVDLVIANNVMAHIPDIRDAFSGVKSILKADGVFVFETHWVGNLIGGGFDQIYHEHLYYHSLTALKHLTDSLGLKIFNIERFPIHGESLRVFVSENREPTPAVKWFINYEQRTGLNKEETYTNFAAKIERNKRNLKEMLGRYDNVVGYGAPAKGNTLLNYFEIDPVYLVDTTPLKQGLYTPGRHIKVCPPEELCNDPPDAILILAWNYADSIIEKEKHLGIPFIIPVPEARIV